MSNELASKEQLEAANQRELELLAVIAIARSALLMRGLNGAAAMLSIEPSQALREHEAKIVAEYKQRAEAAEAKLRELEMQEPVVWLEADSTARGESPRNVIRSMMYSMRFTYAEPQPTTNVFWPLYAKPFPAPKQEEK